MLQLTSEYRFDIKQRGVVFTFAGIAGLNPRTLKGERVVIDNYIYTVEGVETYATLNATGLGFGLCVGYQVGEEVN